ncbi:MipA/OmpV family protein [Thetidibacter halocola]|uniref:MipA/OmpV family protein n=1 Tax=Thetidibacter halocola TaxID=2827239 RepID=A0A8J7WIQ7_9RHOB|nr:MipA/OmpV family protein [Thetidibacter halocola]MBS0125818.1 MipA/OmpV family protein [Thetidibacter halocola]
MLRQLLALTALAAATSTAALAGSPEATEPAPVLVLPQESAPARSGLVFTLGLGGAVNPAYFGSDEYAFGPSGSFKFHYLGLGGRSFGNPDPTVVQTGFGVHGSLRFVSERDSSDFSEIASLNDIDAALELGLGVGYTARNFEVFADVRRGFGGHEAWVAEAGADAVLRPTDALTVTFGPRLFWGDDDYAGTYFGITATEATAALPAFSPEGGLLSTGLELGMTYRLNDDWGLEGAITYDRLTGDAERSPIVRRGSRDQWGVSFGVTRVIRIGG